mgnify:CR=1 FL=1
MTEYENMLLAIIEAYEFKSVQLRAMIQKKDNLISFQKGQIAGFEIRVSNLIKHREKTNIEKSELIN